MEPVGRAAPVLAQSSLPVNSMVPVINNGVPDCLLNAPSEKCLADRARVYAAASQLTISLLDGASVGGSLGMALPCLKGYLWGLWTADVRTEPLRRHKIMEGSSSELLQASCSDTILIRPRVERGAGFPLPDSDPDYVEPGDFEEIKALALIASLKRLQTLPTVVSVKVGRIYVTYLNGLTPRIRRISRCNRTHIAVEFLSPDGVPPLREAVSLLAISD